MANNLSSRITALERMEGIQPSRRVYESEYLRQMQVDLERTDTADTDQQQHISESEYLRRIQADFVRKG